MLGTKSSGFIAFTVLAGLTALFVLGASSAARAQAEPPTTIPAGGPPRYDPNAITVNGWLLYPSVNFLAENSSNFFISPISKVSGWEFGVTPSVTAEWSNGIHTTTIYGNIQQLEFPTNNLLNSTNGEGTFTQQYAPLRDLNFSLVGDYLHQTLSSTLQSSIPTPVAFTGTTVLPNGNIVLPNGTIVSPSGQVVGQVGPTVTSSPSLFVNPYDQYTATARVQKIFGASGIITLGASLARTNFVNASTTTPDFVNKTFTEDGSFWLGSVFYLYSDGNFNIHTTDVSSAPGLSSTPNLNSNSYRIVGGIGTRQFGLFRASAYFGYQATDTSGVGPAGGNVYGGALTYYPTPTWTFSANIDETVNLAPSGAPASNLAISLPGITPLQIATSSSTETTSATLRSSYIISPQWTANGVFGYTHVAFVGSPTWDNTWVVDASLQYSIWRDLKLTWDYQYSSIVSNVPLTSANRNSILMTATYNF